MTNLIRSVEDLPSWYSLAKYDELVELNEQEWLFNLYIRRTILMTMEFRDERLYAGIAALIESTRQRPVVRLDDPSSTSRQKWEQLLHTIMPSTGIRRISLLELADLILQIPAERLQSAIYHASRLSPDTFEPSFFEKFGPSIDSGAAFREQELRESMMYLSVDTSQPDSILESAFKSALSKKRRETGFGLTTVSFWPFGDA